MHTFSMYVNVSAGRKSCSPWCTMVTRTFRAQREFMLFSWFSLHFHLEDTQTCFRIAACNAKPSLDHGCEENRRNTRVTVEVNIHVLGGHDHTIQSAYWGDMTIPYHLHTGGIWPYHKICILGDMTITYNLHTRLRGAMWQLLYFGSVRN